jgi:predicted Zn-dependent protease with MMP-like domain
MALPDCIIIYKGPIEAYAGQDKEAIRKQVRRTVIHEIGHYWGLGEKRLRELGWA